MSSFNNILGNFYFTTYCTCIRCTHAMPQWFTESRMTEHGATTTVATYVLLITIFCINFVLQIHRSLTRRVFISRMAVYFYNIIILYIIRWHWPRPPFILFFFVIFMASFAAGDSWNARNSCTVSHIIVVKHGTRLTLCAVICYTATTTTTSPN